MDYIQLEYASCKANKNKFNKIPDKETKQCPKKFSKKEIIIETTKNHSPLRNSRQEYIYYITMEIDAL